MMNSLKPNLIIPSQPIAPKAKGRVSEKSGKSEGLDLFSKSLGKAESKEQTANGAQSVKAERENPESKTRSASPEKVAAKKSSPAKEFTPVKGSGAQVVDGQASEQTQAPVVNANGNANANANANAEVEAFSDTNVEASNFEKPPVESKLANDVAAKDAATKEVTSKEVPPVDPKMFFAGLQANSEVEAAPVQGREALAPIAPNDDGEIVVPMQATQEVMEKFLEELKDNFGVTPEQLVAAMATLSPKDLELPPEQNVGKIIDQLKLNPLQKMQAKKLFENMVIETEHSRWADFIKASGLDLNAELLTRQELGKRDANQKIDKMNASFFMATPPQKLENAQTSIKGAATPQRAMQAYQAQAGAQPNIASEVNPQQSPDDQGQAMWAPAAAITAASAGPKFSEAVSTKSEASVKDEKLQALIDKATGGSKKSIESTKEKSQAQGESLANDSSDSDLKDLMDSLGISDSSASSDAIDQPSQSFGQVMNSQKSHQAAAPAFGLGASQLNMTETQKQENMNEVIQSARILAEDGGGEMKIRLNPDNLGEVNLKVNVKDGQVNVEIITETSDMKKLFEKGLGELKASLSSHHLSVEGIKVDTAQNMAQDYMKQQAHQQDRNQAQQFLQQFKQDNQAWRRGFFDDGSARRVTSQIEDKADVTLQKAKSSNSAKKLDLVA